MDITQTFYDNLAAEYDKLFSDWEAAMREQAVILDKLFHDNGFNKSSRILDCACGIGTQSIGLAVMGYDVTSSDISENELTEAKKRTLQHKVEIRFEKADSRKEYSR